MTPAEQHTRYLTEAHFEAPRASLTMDGDEYTGVVERLEFEVDLLTGITYGTMVLRFVPVEGDGETLDVGADFSGYIDSYCSSDDGSRRPPSMMMYVTPGEPLPSHGDAPEACITLFEALRATPDDPNAPPPPYSLDDTPDDGPGSTPFAPPPG